MVFLIAICSFVATFFGGFLALKLKDKLHLILGFSAGAVIAVVFFDLLPESLELTKGYFEPNTVFTVTAIGFVFYLLIDRLIFLHAHSHHDGDEDDCDHDMKILNMGEVNRGILGAGSLSLHSFLDGLAIGLSFQVSSAVGLIVAAAVLAHDFSDGINTVNMILKSQGSTSRAFKWLIIDSLAPILGIVVTLFFTVKTSWLGLFLALFAGFFLYIGASDLIPESHHAHPKFLTTAMTIMGLGILYIFIKLAI